MTSRRFIGFFRVHDKNVNDSIPKVSNIDLFIYNCSVIIIKCIMFILQVGLIQEYAYFISSTIIVTNQ